jgi:uncharacterized ParB-like nuclease family protein
MTKCLQLIKLAKTKTMKRLFLFISIFFLFGVLSCVNTEETPAPGDFPVWIKYKVDELSAKTGESCEFIWVMVYEVKGKRYYNIDFAYASCNDCNLYDRNGNRVTSNVLANQSETKIIEQRQACVFPK